METLKDEKIHPYYMVNGGLVQIRTNIDMNIHTRIQKRTAKVLPKNVVGEKECINDNWHNLVNEINEILKKDDSELVHYNVDK